MFWRSKKNDASSKVQESQSLEQQADFDRALDTIAHFIKTYGNYAFDLENIDATQLQSECEHWIQKITVGEGKKEDEQELPPEEFQRDWGGLRRFFTKRRSEEKEFVDQSFSDLRIVIQTFVHTMTSSVLSDQNSDARIESQSMRMASALEENDTTAIRREGSAMVVIIREEIQQRQERVKDEVERLAESIQQLKVELKKTKAEASLDGLTRLYNRASFDEHMKWTGELAFLTNSTPVLFMLDIDHFKSVNDEYGHQAGDIVIGKIADTLDRNFFRKEDFVARYGGEEFAMITNESSMKEAMENAERIRRSVEALEIIHKDTPIRVTVSIGFSFFDPGEDVEKWAASADKALYEAKGKGRNRIAAAQKPES